MLTTSEKWKQHINRDDRKCRAYLSLSGTTISDDLFDYKIKDTIYDDDFIGSFTKKRCDINVLNKQRKYDFDNQKLQVYAGLEYEDESSEYLFLGTYIVTTATYDDVNYQSTLECYDISTLFDIPYKNSVSYPCTMRQYIKACCDACNVTLSNKSFNMEDVLLSSEPYLSDGSTYRDAIRQIVKTCLSCAQIINDELVITTVNRTNKTSDFTLNDYFDLSTEGTIGPYNVLTLSRTPQEDNYVYPNPLPKNPIEYRIENDVVVDSNRELFAPIMYNFINGLTFIPCNITLLKGRPEICSLDYFTFNDMEEVERQSIVFTHEFTFDGNFSSTISCKSKSKTQTNYKRAGTLTKRVQSTELWVDKAAGEIASLIKDMYEENGVVNTNYTQILQTIKDIVFTVQTSGGTNLILNSVGFAGTESWETSGGVSTLSSVDLQQNTVSGGAFVLTKGSITQRITVKANSASTSDEDKQYYSFSCKIKKGADSSGTIRIYNDEEEYIIELDETTQKYTEFSLKSLSPKMNYYNIELKSINGEILFSDNMLNMGNITSQWTQASGEILNTQVNITNNGIIIKSIQFDTNGQYTIISPLEFSGYAKVNGVQTRVFTLNGDTTEVEKIKARSGIDMTPIKIVPINDGDVLGWAFVPSGGDS